jgi:hypothetical protein
MKEKVEWEDVQGIVLSGYGELLDAAYLLWRFQPDDLPRKRVRAQLFVTGEP